jgi:hypothetical protein
MMIIVELTIADQSLLVWLTRIDNLLLVNTRSNVHDSQTINNMMIDVIDYY